MKKYLQLSLVLLCHLSMTAESFVTATDTIKIDSTFVRYFYEDLNKYTLGNISDYDTTTLLTSYYEPLETPYSIYQTLSNSGLAHKNISFSYPRNIGFNTDPTSFQSYIRKGNNIKFPIIYQPFTEIKYMMGDKKEQHLEILFSPEIFPKLFITLNYYIDFSPGA